jgi:hypothetical protein
MERAVLPQEAISRQRRDWQTHALGDQTETLLMCCLEMFPESKAAADELQDFHSAGS